MSGECTFEQNSCLANEYCPITQSNDISPAKCQSCTATMDAKFSCNCTNNDAIEHCQECSKGECIKCHPKFFLFSNNCFKCSQGCEQCNIHKCDKCSPGYRLTDNKCEKIKTRQAECKVGQFINIDRQQCNDCSPDCADCISLEVCGACKTTDLYVDIAGKCHQVCQELKNGQYCNKSTAQSCKKGITSPCKCETSRNCATCTADLKQCKSCLQGFQLKDGDCQRCQKGFAQLSGICLPQKVDQSQKVSTGAVIGIVVSCLLCISAVGGGIAYYFVKLQSQGTAFTHAGQIIISGVDTK